MPDTRPMDEEKERHYTLSISDEDRERSFQIEDDRWSRSNQIRDWLKLGAMILIALITYLLIYFLEPGLRDPTTLFR